MEGRLVICSLTRFILWLICWLKRLDIDIHTSNHYYSSISKEQYKCLLPRPLLKCKGLNVLQFESQWNLIVRVMLSIIERTWGADLQKPSSITLPSLTRGTKHRAHSLGIRPISPFWLVEKRTISEMGPPLPRAAGDLREAAGGKEKATVSPAWMRLPLQVESPDTSALPINHQSLSSPLSLLLSSLSLGRESGAGGVEEEKGRDGGVEEDEGRGGGVEEEDGGGGGGGGGGEGIGGGRGRKWRVSKMMLMAAVGSLLAKCKARIMSISLYSGPTTDLTTSICSSLAFFPIPRFDPRPPFLPRFWLQF